MMTTPQQDERLRRLRVQTGDLREHFCRSGGPGGQHVNKVETAVCLVHLPSGLQVTCEESRSRAANRRLALDRLLEKLEGAQTEARQKRQAAAAKVRRQKAQRSPLTKARLRRAKVRRSQIKSWRRAETPEG